MKRIDRYRGALLGFASGDAFEATPEFKPPGSFKPINGIVGGGPSLWTLAVNLGHCWSGR